MIAKNLRAVATALVFGTAALAASSMPADAALRRAVGTPLQEAQSLAASGNYSAALAKVRQAEGAGSLTAEEARVVKQMKDYITVKAGGSGGPVESLPGAQAKFAADYNGGRYREVINDEDLLRKFGGLNANAMVVIGQAYSKLGDYKGCVAYANSHSSAGPDMFKLGGLCAFRAGDDALALEMAEKLVAVSPTPENWSQLLRQAERAKGLSDAQTVDIYRLKLLTGNIKEASDYFLLAQMLVAARLPSEADKVVQQGQAAKLLVDARAQRLAGLVKQSLATDLANFGKAQAAAQKAPTGDELVKLGEDLTGMGKFPEAIAAIQAGIGKGVKDADNAQVRLAVALANNKQKPQALSALDKAKSTPNGKLVARMWAAFIRAH